MKKTISILLIIFTILILFSCGKNESTSSIQPSPKPTPITDFTFEENDDNIVITKYNGTDETVVVPEKISNKPVTQIGYNAFFNNKLVVYIYLPSTVITIKDRAFENCESLSKITLPDGLEEIGGAAFQNCQKLSDIVLPKKLKAVAANAFSNCKSLKQITIPKACALGIEAFYNSGLNNITIESGVTKISDTCFAGTNVKELILPQTIEKIGWQAFADCKNLKTVTLNEGLKCVGDLAFYSTNISEIIIPSTVTEIKESTFSKCSNLDKIKFEGDAPKEFLRMLQDTHFGAENVHFTIYYHKNASGFTSPQWNGYPAEIW